MLLIWDEPIQQWVESPRSAGLDTAFRGFSKMDSTYVIFGAFALIVVAATRCRALAFASAVAVLPRPLFEFAVEELVGRDRPDLERLVAGNGPSHPSGHVLAAVTGSAILITGIFASRVYLGVHWLSDIVQGLLLGWLFLAFIETVYDRAHKGRSCSGTVLADADADPLQRRTL